MFLEAVLNTNNMIFEKNRLLFKGKRKLPIEKEPLINFAELVKWMINNKTYFVISSSWRINSAPEDWNKILKYFGIKKI